MHFEVTGINKKFGKKEILSGISFNMNQGEIVALMGESGCGKSTLLRIIAGFENSDAGSVELNGKEIHRLVPHKRKVGMFFQDYALFPHMTVFENIAYGISSSEKLSTKVAELVEMCELEGLENVYPHQISGGQKQRVALARALAPDPEILLLDEPFSNIDAILRENLRLELKRMLKGRNLSVIIVSHDIEDALVLANKAIILHKGGIVQEGSIRELYKKPKNAFVAQFVGEVNILEGMFNEQGFNFDDRLISCVCTSQCSDGNKLSVRPENIELIPSEKSSDSFQIKQIIFKRSYCVIEVESKQSRIFAHVPNKHDWKEGDYCQIAINEYHILH